ncbi:MAG: methyltransferase [Lentisphaeria bacterium]|nr:methyltransferase [Lentisphaeria bacterium]
MSEARRRHVAARFSAAAGTYEQQPGVQEAVACAVADMVSDSQCLHTPSRAPQVLEIGCGTGYLTEQLCTRFPKAGILAMDLAPGMIVRARERLGDQQNVRWLASDVKDLRLGSTYDLITSSSALHWVDELGDTLRHLASVLTKEGAMIFSLMVQGTLRELHELRREVAPHKFALPSLPRKEDVLEDVCAAGLEIVNTRSESMGVRHPSAREFLRTLNRQGVTGQAPDAGCLLSRTELQRLIAAYETQCQCKDGGVNATYEILFVHASASRRQRIRSLPRMLVKLS